MKAFGRFKGMPHEGCNENFEDYKKFKNTIPKEKVIAYLESNKVEKCYGLMPSYDMFTREKIECGIKIILQHLNPAIGRMNLEQATMQL